MISFAFYLPLLLSLQFIGVAATCPSRSVNDTDVKNLISKTNVTSFWIEGGYTNIDDKDWVSISTTLTAFKNASIFISLPNIPGPTSNDGYPAIARIKNVVSSGQVSFQVKIYQANDSYCSKQWSIPQYISPPLEVSWLVVEQGAFSLHGKRLMIGRGLITRQDNSVTNANNFIRFNYPAGCVTSTDSCRFGDSASPGIITQLQTVVYDRILIPRVRAIALSFVRLVLQPHDSATASYYVLTNPETISYLAYEGGMSVSCSEGIVFEGSIFASVTSNPVYTTFGYTYVVPPAVFGIIGSSISLADSTGLRVFNRTTVGTSIITQEDKCVDEETTHITSESVFTLTIGTPTSSSCLICKAKFTSSYLQPTSAPTPKPTGAPTFSPTYLLYSSDVSVSTLTTELGTYANTRDISISSDGLFALYTLFDGRIKKVIISTAVVTTLAGVAGGPAYADGIGSNARFQIPFGISISPDDSYALVADVNNAAIRKIILSTASVSTFASLSAVVLPQIISISSDGSFALYTTLNHLIRKIIISNASISTLAGSSQGSTNGVGSNALFNNPTGVSISPDGSFALIADDYNHLIRKIILSTSSVTTLAGSSQGSTNGVGSNALFNRPTGVSISPDGSFALITEANNKLIRRIIISTASVSSLAGVAGSSGFTDGVGTNSLFREMFGISISPADSSFALVADHGNFAIRKLQSIPYLPTVVPTAKPT